MCSIAVCWSEVKYIQHYTYRLTILYGLHQKTLFVSIWPHSSAHSGTEGSPAHDALHCQVGLAPGRSLGTDWRRRPGHPCARWTDQLRNDTGSVSANCQPLETSHPRGPYWSDATAQAGHVMTTTTIPTFLSAIYHICWPLHTLHFTSSLPPSVDNSCTVDVKTVIMWMVPTAVWWVSYWFMVSQRTDFCVQY